MRVLFSQIPSFFSNLRTKLRIPSPIAGLPRNKISIKTNSKTVVKPRLNTLGPFGGALSSYITSIFSLVYYAIEWMSVLIGFLTFIISLGVYFHPDFIVVVILPVLTTFLANYQVSMLLGFLGFEWFPESPQTWSDLFWSLTYTSFNWGHWIITNTVNIPLLVFDHAVSTLIWWNTFAVNFVLTGFGFFGLWAFLKVAGIIKFIYASTIAAMTMGQLSGIIPGVLTFCMQTLILAFVDPIAALINSPSLGSLITFILPDPLGIWNAFITVNLLPWVWFRELVTAVPFNGLITLFTMMGVTVWNAIVQDITWFSLNTILHVSQTPADIVTYILGPLDQRLGQIISSVQSLRSLWR